MLLWWVWCSLFFELTFLMFKYSWCFANGACVPNVLVFGVPTMVIVFLMFLLLVFSILTMVLVLLMFILMVFLWWFSWFWCCYWCSCNGHPILDVYSWCSCDGCHGLEALASSALVMVVLFLMFLLPMLSWW